jgi:hypothetical protein
MPSHLSPTLPLIKQIVNSEDVTLLPWSRDPATLAATLVPTVAL